VNIFPLRAMSARTVGIDLWNKTTFRPPTLPREAEDTVNGQNLTGIQNDAVNAPVKPNDILEWLTASTGSGRFLTI
jgi:hypothetical protein